MKEAVVNSHLIQEFWEAEQWEKLSPLLDSALSGEHYSGQDLLTLSVSAVELGRLTAARELLGKALKTGGVPKREAIRFLLGRAQRVFETAGHFGSSNVQAETPFSSELNRWYRSEGELGVYVPSQRAGLTLSQVDPACIELVEHLAARSDKAWWSNALQLLFAESTYRALFYHEQVNLLQPYSKDLNGLRVLELNCQGGLRTRFLAEAGARVTAVTAQPEHALLTAALCSDFPSVQVVLDSPHLIPFRGQYDLVVMAGYQEGFAATADVLAPLSHLLSRVYSALAPNGSLLIGGHNALAMRHFNDQRDAYGQEGSAVVEGRVVDRAPQLWSASAIAKALKASGFYQQEQCALMGTLERPGLMVSPIGCGLSSEHWNLDTLVRRALRNSDSDRLARFSESRVFQSVMQGGELPAWSDGYVFLAHKSAESWIDTSGWLASSFYSGGEDAALSEMRFVQESEVGGALTVERHSLNAPKVRSVCPYLNGTVLRDLLDDLMQVPGWTFEQVLQWSTVWLRYLLSSIKVDDSLGPKGKFSESYNGEYDLWVPDELFNATPTQWVKGSDGGCECLHVTAGSDGSVPIAMVLYSGLLSTFSTLRSVAEPADSDWLEPVVLAEALVNQLGFGLQADDRDVLNAHWLQVTKKPMPIPKRFLARQAPRSLIDEAKLYWATEFEGFSESKSSTDNLALDGGVQTLRLAIASPEVQLTALRFDVANRPGCFEIEDMAILKGDGEVLWRWGHSHNMLSGVQGCTLVTDPETERSCVLSRGNDPQFVLEGAKPFLDEAAGGVLQVTLSAWPQRL